MHTEKLDPFTLCWPDGVFPLGADSLALGAFTTVRRTWRVCDLGTGSGILLFLLRRREATLSLSGIELDELSAQTARSNLKRNQLSGEIISGDLRHPPYAAGSFDLVVSNPPYFALGSGISSGNARSEETCTLEALCASAAYLTRNGGRFSLCYRPERLTDLMVCLRQNGFEPKRMCLLSHDSAHPPFVVLLESVKQGKPGLEITIDRILM